MHKILYAMGAVVAVVACSDPVGIQPFDGHIALSPAVVFLEAGETKSVTARWIADPEGFSSPTDFSVTASAGITVSFDSTFRQVYQADGSLGPFPEATEQRLLVTMTTAVESGTVTVSNEASAADLVVHRRP